MIDRIRRSRMLIENGGGNGGDEQFDEIEPQVVEFFPPISDINKPFLWYNYWFDEGTISIKFDINIELNQFKANDVEVKADDNGVLKNVKITSVYAEGNILKITSPDILVKFQMYVIVHAGVVKGYDKDIEWSFYFIIP